ncbi:MAG: hypothetical protein E7191_01365 [Erysipelotrichaceae bacterium]|nr:hypothetical protein [Erysipelotrichaceae bacterium]
MKYIVRILVLLSILFVSGCSKTIPSFTTIPAFQNNYETGSYQYTEDYPHIEVLSSACEVGEYQPMSNYMNCETLKEEFEITEYPEQDYSSMILQEETEVIFKLREYEEKQDRRYTWEYKEGKELFNTLLETINNEIYYPSEFKPTYVEDPKQVISISYTLQEYKKVVVDLVQEVHKRNVNYSVEIETYDDSGMGYILMRVYKQGPYEEVMVIRCYGDVSKIIDTLVEMKDSAEVEVIIK